MTIVIDLQGAQSHSRFRGIGRYSLSLSLAIAKKYSETHNIIIALNGMFMETIPSIREAFHNLLPKSNIRVWQACQPTEYSQVTNDSRRDSASLLYESFLASLSPDIVLVMSTIEGYNDNAITANTTQYLIPTATIFYDAIPYMQADKYITPLGKQFEKYYFEKIDSIKNADVVFGISKSSCQEAVEVLGLPTSKVINIYAAVSDYFRPKKYNSVEKKEILDALSIKKKFLLYTGATDERKNHLRLIKAFSLLPLSYQKEYQLVIAGGMPVENKNIFKQHIKACQLSSEDVILTGRVSDKELLDLYNLCDLYVFPSYHEGFGLPALEAMQCGAATIGANTTSIPEVIGRKDALFDPFDETSISNKILAVLSDEDFKKTLQQHSLEQSKKFSWEKSADKLIAGLEKWYHTFSEQQKASSTYIDTLISSLAKIKNTKKNLLTLSQSIAFNHENTQKKQLLIDISELCQNDAKSGIQRVVRSVLKELYANPPKGYTPRAVYANTDTLGYFYADKFMHNFLYNTENTSIIDYNIDMHADDIFLALDMAPNIHNTQKPYLEQLKNLGLHIHFIIYDLLLIHNPQWWPTGVASNFEKWFNTVISVSDNLCCISKNVQEDVMRYLKVNYTAQKTIPSVNYFHLGADIAHSHPSKGLPKESTNILALIKDTPTFLMVGTIEPRKGHLQTINAFDKLWQDGINVNLVIIGKQAWLVDELVQYIKKHPKLNQNLFWLQGISDEYLEKVYEASTCLLVASEGEGFGLPLIEASQKGLPIIARDIPIFREVAGKHAHYFPNVTLAETLAQTIDSWLNLKKADLHPKSDKIPWLTWKESTLQLVQCLKVN